MSHKPKVSVLIPTYNYAHILGDAIESVLNQTFADFELIIVDDASKDNTDEVVQEYLSDRRVSYYKNEKNLGLVGNWNKCLSLARGEYIKFLCADDQFRSDLLEKFVAAFEQNPTVSLVACCKETFGKSRTYVELPFKGLHKGKDIIYHTLNNFGWLGEPSCVMFKRSNVSVVGAFNPNVLWLPDWEMWIRHLTVGDCYILSEPLAYVQNHSGQLTKTVTKNFINYFEEYDLCQAIKEKKGYNIDLSGIDMKKVIKRRAVNCAKAVYKTLPQLHKKDRRAIFFKAFKIAVKEGVLFDPVFNNFSSNKQDTILKFHPIKEQSEETVEA